MDPKALQVADTKGMIEEALPGNRLPILKLEPRVVGLRRWWRGGWRVVAGVLVGVAFVRVVLR